MPVSKGKPPGVLTMASHSKSKSYLQYLHVMGTDATFVIISKSVCAADWEQDPWAAHHTFTTIKCSCWVLTAVNLQKAEVLALGKPLFSKTNPSIISCLSPYLLYWDAGTTLVLYFSSLRTSMSQFCMNPLIPRRNYTALQDAKSLGQVAQSVPNAIQLHF